METCKIQSTMSFIVVSSYYKIMIYLHESQGANPIGKALVHSISIQLFTYSWNPTKLLQSNFISAVIKGGKHRRRKRGGGNMFWPPPIIQTCLGKWSLKYHNLIKILWKCWSFRGLLDPCNKIDYSRSIFHVVVACRRPRGTHLPPPQSCRSSYAYGKLPFGFEDHPLTTL